MTVDNDLLKKIRSKKGEERVILSLEEKGYFVGLGQNGESVDKEAREVSEFAPLMETSTVAWVDYVVDDTKNDAPKAAVAIGFGEHLVNHLLNSGRSAYADFDTEMGFVIPAIITNGFDVKVNPLIVLIKKNLVMTIHTTEIKRFFRLRRYAKIFTKKIKPSYSQADKITLLLARILDENNRRNFDHLHEIEECADKVSEKLSKTESSREELGKDIHNMRHALISYLSALWECIDVLNALRYGDPELLTDNPILLQRLSGLSEDVNNQIGLAEHMSEVLASGLEVMQSIYNNQLQIFNNKLALLVGYLTVIGTALLVPNTIATALGSSAFALTPADQGWYIALLIGSTVVATILSFLWVKHAGLLPKKVD